jgi:predicted DNA binding CopG/RHH family protein
MSRQIQYTDEPIGDFRQVVDFLPSPEELKLKSETTKITISLSSESLAYFKEVAKANHIQYQKMIRQLLDDYVTHQKNAGE